MKCHSKVKSGAPGSKSDKYTLSKQKMKQLKGLEDNNSIDLDGEEIDLAVSDQRHLVTKFEPGYHLRSVSHGGLFTCESNKVLIEKSKHKVYGNAKVLY